MFFPQLYAITYSPNVFTDQFSQLQQHTPQTCVDENTFVERYRYTRTLSDQTVGGGGGSVRVMAISI